MMMNPPPDAVMMQMLMGRTVSFALAAAARLGVAEAMGDEPRDVAALAAQTGTREDLLYRLLRTLASLGVFTQSGRAFGLTPLGRLLRADAPGSLRNMAAMFSDDWVMGGYGKLAEAVRTGQDGVTLALGEDAWSYFAKSPEPRGLFQQAMTDFTRIAGQALVEAYDFAGVQRLADVGGGHGTLLAMVLRAHEGMTGVLFDLPEVVESAKRAGLLAFAGERVGYEEGSFFDAAPEGCDAYLLKHILHDWSEEKARTILTRIRERMSATARVLVFEMVVPDPPQAGPALMLDLEMMVATQGGRERTAAEFEALLESAGLRLERIVPTASPLAVIEARRS